jgi:hypothetical protein
MSSIVDTSEFALPGAAMRWRSWPAREHPLVAVLVLAALVGAALAVRWLCGQPYLAWLAAAALAASLWRFFLPIDYELGEDGIDQWLFGHHRRIPWSAISRYEVWDAAILLLPQDVACPLDLARSFYLPCRGRRDEVLAEVRQRLGDMPEGPGPRELHAAIRRSPS